MDDSRIRKERVPDSKISGYVWTGPQLGVLRLQIPVNNVVDYNELMTRYKNVFTGIGKLKDFQLNLHIDQQVQPAAQTLRRPAFSLREKNEKKLDELLREDIIEKIEGPKPWVNPVGIVCRHAVCQ